MVAAISGVGFLACIPYSLPYIHHGLAGRDGMVLFVDFFIIFSFVFFLFLFFFSFFFSMISLPLQNDLYTAMSFVLFMRCTFVLQMNGCIIDLLFALGILLFFFFLSFSSL